MLFHLKSDWDSNTKEVEDFPIFPTAFTCPHPLNGLGTMTFCKMMGLMKTVFWTYCSGKRKMKYEAVRVGFSP
jgi:hypothetical protein